MIENNKNRLLKLGCPQGLIDTLAPLLSSEEYTDAGIKQLILGFTTLTMPRKLGTVRGEIPVRLEVIKTFKDYEEFWNEDHRR